MGIKLKDFVTKYCNKYFIRILNDSKRCVKHRPPTAFFKDAMDKNIVFTHPPENDSEPLLTVEIPASKLEAMAEIEFIFYNKIGDIAAGNVFETWMNQQNQERMLRNRHPAIMQAYEAYSTLLHLATEKPLTFNNLQPPSENG